ncbi:MAG: hypothetical protein ABR616_18415 [Dermatophilaceae bacterium]
MTSKAVDAAPTSQPGPPVAAATEGTVASPDARPDRAANGAAIEGFDPYEGYDPTRDSPNGAHVEGLGETRRQRRASSH